MEFELAAYLLGFGAAFLVGLSKTGVPGVAIPAIVCMTEAFSGNEKLSVGALLPVLLVGDLLAVRIYRRHAEWKRLGDLFLIIPQKVFNSLVLVLAALAALRMVGLFGFL